MNSACGECVHGTNIPQILFDMICPSVVVRRDAGGGGDAGLRMECGPSEPEALDGLDLRRGLNGEDLSFGVAGDPHVAAKKALLDRAASSGELGGGVGAGSFSRDPKAQSRHP